MDKALIVGAGGGLGRVFRDRMGGGWDVVALDRAELDVSRRNDVMDRVREHRPAVLVNAAGFADVDGCEIEKWRAYLVNRDGAKHLAAAAADVDALLVQVSTDLVFDGTKSTPYREEDPPNPLSVYADTKLAAELAVMTGAPRHLVVRTGWLFGPHGRSFLGDAIREREGADMVQVPEDQRGQPTHQHDFVDAVLELVRRHEAGVWHAANAGDATQAEAVQEAFDLLGLGRHTVKPSRRGPGSRAALRPRSSVLEIAKLQGAGIRMRPWVEALRSWLRK
jgi:dTDP-4-dehydrorhamnose reductase